MLMRIRRRGFVETGAARVIRAIAFGGLSLLAAATPDSRTSGSALPLVQSNPNTARAGVLSDGVLTVTLEAKPSLWYLDGHRRPAMTIEAFSEPGKPPVMPAPLIRVPAGTELHLTIRNSLAMPLTFFLPAVLRGTAGREASRDSLFVPPGTARTLTTRANVPGNYAYRGETPTRLGKLKALGTGLLAGAIVVDTAGPVAPL